MSGFQYHFDWHIFISHYLHLVNALSFNSHKWFSLPSFCVCFLAAVTIKVTTELKWHWSDELMHLSISPSMVINKISATLSRKRQPSNGRKKNAPSTILCMGCLRYITFLPKIYWIQLTYLQSVVHAISDLKARKEIECKSGRDDCSSEIEMVKYFHIYMRLNPLTLSMYVYSVWRCS